MPTQPAATRSSPPDPPSPPGPPAEKSGLTVNQVVAGAGAAATSAVLGSFFGAAGTVAGAALGSVASTLAGTLYQRSLDRTRDTVAARIRRPRVDPELTIPMPRISPERSSRGPGTTAPAPPPTRRPWLRRSIAGALLVFVLGLSVVTGLEWAKGSTLVQGESGTSVGRVVGPAPVVGDPSSSEVPAGSEPEPTAVDPAPADEGTEATTAPETTDGPTAERRAPSVAEQPAAPTEADGPE